MEPVYRFEITVAAQMVDLLGHVNNVTYVQWMQDAAIRHARTTGAYQAASFIGATWVVRTHHVEYLKPAVVGDVITVMTWVADFQKVQSLRKYKFIRVSDQAVLVEAQTNWVFINESTGRPMAIPEEIKDAFSIVNSAGEP